MVAQVEDRVIDYGLSTLAAEATHIYICSAEPTNFTEATTTYALGFKSFGPGAVFDGPPYSLPNGRRRLTTVAIDDGVITLDGFGAWWAIVDVPNERLLAHSEIGGPWPVAVARGFTFAPFNIGLPSKIP